MESPNNYQKKSQILNFRVIFEYKSFLIVFIEFLIYAKIIQDLKNNQQLKLMGFFRSIYFLSFPCFNILNKF